MSGRAPASLLRQWRRGELPAGVRPELVAGLTVAAMLVPQAMAYAELGGLPPDAGFRAALVVLPVYVLIGTSRHLGVGPEPGTAILAAAAAASLAGDDPARYAAAMAAIAGIVGALTLAAGLLRLGFVAELLSKPVLVGYITGVGLTLLTSQLRPLTGVPVDADHPVERVGQFVTRLGDVDAETCAVGVAALVIILAARWFRPTWPGALLALGAAMAAVALIDLDVALVGSIDAAFPDPSVPDVSWGDVADLLPAAAGVALVGYTDNILTARSIAAGKGYEIDADRELLALGAMNSASAVSGGFVVSSSASRSVVPASIGSRSQLSSMVTLVAVIVLLLVGRSLLAEIPRPALAAVIVAAGIAVLDVDGFRRLARIDRAEVALAAVTCAAVVGVDLLLGVVVAVGLSMGLTLARVARPHDAVLGEAAGLDGWIDVEDERASPLPGLLVYRFDAPLFFANAEHFRDRIVLALDRNPGVEQTVVLDLEGIGSVDATAVGHLSELFVELRERGADVAIARPNQRVLDTFERAGLLDDLGADAVFPTINAAVAAHRRRRA